MNTRNFVFFLFFSFVFFSCSSPNSNKIAVNNKNFKYHINVETPLETAEIKDVLSDYKYIKLETSKHCLLGEITKMLIYGNRIYMLSNGIYCFDMSGKFLYAIDQIGKGPSEFIMATDMSIDNNKIYLYDNSQAKVIVFNPENGSVLNTFSLKYSVQQVQFIDNSMVLNRGGIPNEYIKGSERLFISTIDNQSQVQPFIPFNEYDIAVANQFYGYNKNAYWLDPLFNKVYKINAHKIDSYIYFDGGEHNVEISDVTSGVSLKNLRAMNKMFFISDVYETDETISGNIFIGEAPCHILYDKKSKKTIAYKEAKLKPFQSAPYAQAVYNNSFYKIVSLVETRFLKYDMIDKKFSLTPNDPDFANYNIIKSFNDGDNPIVAVYKVKSF